MYLDSIRGTYSHHRRMLPMNVPSVVRAARTKGVMLLRPCSIAPYPSHSRASGSCPRVRYSRLDCLRITTSPLPLESPREQQIAAQSLVETAFSLPAW